MRCEFMFIVQKKLQTVDTLPNQGEYHLELTRKLYKPSTIQ
jgi:hypothetical protein